MELSRRGFTLIELLVVVTIIIILLGIVAASAAKARAGARDDKRITDLAQIELALELYVAQNGDYPKESEGFGGGGTSIICDGCSALINDVIRTYLGHVPSDPRHDGDTYYYYYDGNQTCGSGLPNQAVLFARTMEESVNRTTIDDGICTELGGEGGSDSESAHVVILGPSAG